MLKSILKMVFSIVGILVCLVCVPMIVLNIVLIVNAYMEPEHIPSAFGVKPMICMSGSMSPTFEAGDLVFAKVVNTDELKTGDVISYLISGVAVTHRIIEVVSDGETNSYVTKGDANNVEDAERVYPDMVEGVYTGVSVPELGNFAIFMQSTTGMIIFVVCPLMLLVIYNVIRQSMITKEEKKRAIELERELAAMRARQGN